MEVDRSGWNDPTGSASISTFTVMMENLGIYNDADEHIMFHALIIFWNMEFKPKG